MEENSAPKSSKIFEESVSEIPGRLNENCAKRNCGFVLLGRKGKETERKRDEEEYAVGFGFEMKIRETETKVGKKGLPTNFLNNTTKNPHILV